MGSLSCPDGQWRYSCSWGDWSLRTSWKRGCHKKGHHHVDEGEPWAVQVWGRLKPSVVALKYIHKCFANHPLKKWSLILLPLRMGWTKWFISNKQNIADMSMCGFCGQVMKDSFNLAPSWITCSGEGQLPCHRILKQSVGGATEWGWGLLPKANKESQSPAMWGSHLQSGFSSHSQTFRSRQPLPTPWWKLHEIRRQNHWATLLPNSSSTEKINVCCLKLPSFEICCHAAVDN